MSASAAKTLDVLAVLLGHFANGLAPGDLAKATGLDPSAITRYVAVLEEKGFAERIPETGRVRPSLHLARHALSILRSIDVAEARLVNLKQRLS
ncbi:MAG: MarR family transcriptional regulator [Azonexus sp.]|jgi:DNA-binding IclR family transcriptional regulator|nr:MarR family transcriptional regulator [Azonexus sp.]